MSVEVYTNKFITVFTKFIDDISELPFNYVKEKRELINSVINLFPNKIIEFFNDYVMRYAPMIKERNEDFFLKTDFTSLCEGDSEIIANIFSFKDTWRSLSDNNKKAIMDYANLLVVIVEKINKYK